MKYSTYRPNSTVYKQQESNLYRISRVASGLGIFAGVIMAVVGGVSGDGPMYVSGLVIGGASAGYHIGSVATEKQYKTIEGKSDKSIDTAVNNSIKSLTKSNLEKMSN